jgi:hypothetical protein
MTHEGFVDTAMARLHYSRHVTMTALEASSGMDTEPVSAGYHRRCDAAVLASARSSRSSRTFAAVLRGLLKRRLAGAQSD